MQLAKYEGVRLAQLGDDDFRNPSLLEDALQHLIEHQVGDRIVLDLSRVQSLTSMGVAVLVAARGIAIVLGLSHFTPFPSPAAAPGGSASSSGRNVRAPSA